MTIEQTQTADGLFKRKSSPEKTHPLTLIGKRGDDGVTNEAPITPNLKLPPWLNDDGSFKSDEEIQSLGKNWSAETWDSYLKVNVGDVEAEDHDLVFFPFVDTETVNFGAELLKTLRTQDDYENLPEAFEFALTFLSDREAQVIRMRYLKELSQEEISERLGVGLNSIGDKSSAIFHHEKSEPIEKPLIPDFASVKQRLKMPYFDPSWSQSRTSGTLFPNHYKPADCWGDTFSSNFDQLNTWQNDSGIRWAWTCRLQRLRHL